MPRNIKRGPLPSDIGDLIDTLDAIEERLAKLEAPSGETLFSTVAKLQRLVADIQAQLDAWVLTRWTNAQVQTAITNSINSTFAGSPTIGGNLTVNGAFYNPPGYAFDITYTRRTAWLGNDGRLGYASSAAEAKTAIRPAGIDPEAVLALEPRSFYYRAEVARRTRLRINEGVDYMPAREYGLLAHELDDLGLGWLVYHDDEGNAEGVEYSMLTVALLAVARAERDARVDLEQRIAKLEQGGAQ